MSKVAIELENELTFDSTPKRVWELMSDVPSLVPCIPGARLLEAVDDSKWRGEVALDLGFTRVVFIADVVRREMDADAGRTVIEIDAVDSKGRSTAKATMTSLLSAADSGTRVAMTTNLAMEGDVARFGPGIIEDVSFEIVEQMSGCLRSRLADSVAERDNKTQTARKLSIWLALRLWIRGRLRRARNKKNH